MPKKIDTLQPVVIKRHAGAYKSKGPTNEKMEAVVGAFKHSWVAYKKYAWGKDELLPLSKTHNRWFDLALTLVEALDTMYIMDLKEGLLQMCFLFNVVLEVLCICHSSLQNLCTAIYISHYSYVFEIFMFSLMGSSDFNFTDGLLRLQ